MFNQCGTVNSGVMQYNSSLQDFAKIIFFIILHRKPANVSTVAEYLEMMLEKGIFVDWLSDKEVCDMTMAQFSRDDILIYQGREEGKAQERAEAVLELLEDIGEPSETLRNYIMKQTDLEVLRRWHKIAAKADSIKEFGQAVGMLAISIQKAVSKLMGHSKEIITMDVYGDNKEIIADAVCDPMDVFPDVDKYYEQSNCVKVREYSGRSEYS